MKFVLPLVIGLTLVSLPARADQQSDFFDMYVVQLRLIVANADKDRSIGAQTELDQFIKSSINDKLDIYKYAQHYCDAKQAGVTREARIKAMEEHIADDAKEIRETFMAGQLAMIRAADIEICPMNEEDHF